MAWLGMAGLGKEFMLMLLGYQPRETEAGQGKARHGGARQGTARQGEARHGKARRGMAWQGKEFMRMKV
jgi:hypothetical protein